MPSLLKWMSLSLSPPLSPGSQRAVAASSWTPSDCILYNWWSYPNTDQTDLNLVCGCALLYLCPSPLRWGRIRGEMPLFPICYLWRCVFLWRRRRRRRKPEATSAAAINYISALFLSPDNHSGSIATFRIFSFFPPLLNTPTAPRWFWSVKVDNRRRNVASVFPGQEI